MSGCAAPADALPTVAAALADAQARGLPREEARWLLAQVLRQPRAWLVAHDDHRLDAIQAARWADWLAQRLDDVPLAYLSGWREFHGLALQVTPAVLDPRPDTETLVDWALEWLAARPRGARVLDLGTGSGAIALALKHRRPDVDLTAVDVSPAALAVARANGERLGLAVHWREGHWLQPVAGEVFDLIVSNPPYIAAGDPHLAALRHEPALALVAGADGLAALAGIATAAPAHLVRGGALLLEHGHDQAAAAARLLGAPAWTAVSHRRDLAGHLRCTGATLSTFA